MLLLQEKIQSQVNSLNAPSPAEPLNHYAYGKDHWQNLCDHEKDGQLPFEKRNKYFKLLWVDEDYKFNEYSAVTGCNYDGELIVLASSKITDPSYQYKFDTHIKNLKEYAENFREQLLNGCGNNWKVLVWKVTEVENLFDNNLDGIKIRFTMYHSL